MGNPLGQFYPNSLPKNYPNQEILETTMGVGQNVGQKGAQKHHFKPQNDPNLCMGTDFRKCTNKKISDNRLIIRGFLRDPAGARTDTITPFEL